MLCILARLDYVISMEYENVCLVPAALLTPSSSQHILGFGRVLGYNLWM